MIAIDKQIKLLSAFVIQRRSRYLGTRHRVLSLDMLIASKRSAGRPKDLLVCPRSKRSSITEESERRAREIDEKS